LGKLTLKPVGVVGITSTLGVSPRDMHCLAHIAVRCTWSTDHISGRIGPTDDLVVLKEFLLPAGDAVEQVKNEIINTIPSAGGRDGRWCNENFDVSTIDIEFSACAGDKRHFRERGRRWASWVLFGVGVGVFDVLELLTFGRRD
jgi:hypothetical protein